MLTDIEGSTRLWEEYPHDMKHIIVRHDMIVDQLIVEHGGRVIDHAGDGAFAVFEQGDPLGCGVAIQRALQHENWGEIGDLRVRIAIHAGHPRAKRDFRGRLANRTARIMACGWGGQILVTPEATRAFPLPPGALLEDQGEHALKDLDEAQSIQSLTHQSLKWHTFPALRSLSNLPNNLPPQPNRFINRLDELRRIADRLSDPNCRLLTLTGSGGNGKSRLALQSAAEQHEKFPDGIYLVLLSPLSSAASVPTAIADALRLNIYGRDEIVVQLVRHFKHKRMLLILDNFEHVMAATELVIQLLQGAAELKILVTSRQRLGLPEETSYPLEGLPFPQNGGGRELEQCSSMQLFVERARSASLAFSAESEQPNIGRICTLVEGVPLGIELAAAWTRILSCAEIADEIERSVDFLETNDRRERRHRSLRAVFEYSWKLAGDDEREAFRRLSVFRGGFTHEAARRVVSASLSSLLALFDKSLIRREGLRRFTIHELLRQLGHEKLSEDGALERRIRGAHSDYFTTFVADRRPRLRGSEVRQAAGEIRQELDNIRSGWDWALEAAELEAIDRAVEDMAIFFETQSRLEEGHAFFARTSRALRAMTDIPEPQERRWRRLCCIATAVQSLFLVYLGRGKEALGKCRQSLELLSETGFPRERGYCLYVLAAAEQQHGNYDRAIDHFEQSVAIFADLNDPYREAHSRGALAVLHTWLGEHEKAEAELRFTISTCASIGDVWAQSISQILLGDIERERGNRVRAKQLFEDSLVVIRDVGDRRWLAAVLLSLAMVAQEEEAYGESEAHCKEALHLTREMGEQRRETICLELLGRLERLRGSFAKAERYLTEALNSAFRANLPPNALDVILEFAELRHAQQNRAQALQLLGIVLGHPGSKRNALVRAGELHRRLERESDREVGSIPEERTADISLEEIVASVIESRTGIPNPTT